MKTFEDIVNLFPERVKNILEENKNLRERPDYHPESNAYFHIKIVTERGISTGIPELMIIGLFHDISKFRDHKINPKNGWPTCPGHDLHGAELSREYLDIIKSFGADPDAVYWVCFQHMRAKDISIMRKSKQDELRNHIYWPLLETFERMDDMLTEFIP